MDSQIEVRLRSLSERERQVLWLVNEPMTSSEIARALGGISPNTVNRYAATGCRKIGVNDRRAASRLVRASPGLRALLNDWLAQTMGEVGAAAVVLQDLRRLGALELTPANTASTLDAGGGRNSPPADVQGAEPGHGAPPADGVAGRPSAADACRDAPRASEHPGGDRVLDAIPHRGMEGWAWLDDLIPRSLRVVGASAAGLLLALLLTAGVYVVIRSLQFAHNGPP